MKKLLIILLTVCMIYSQETINIDDIYISIIENANIKMPENGKDFTEKEKEIIRINTLNFLINEYNENLQKEKSYEKAFNNLMAYLGYDSNIAIRKKGDKDYEVALYFNKDLEYKSSVYVYDIITIMITQMYGSDVKATIIPYKDKALKVMKGK